MSSTFCCTEPGNTTTRNQTIASRETPLSVHISHAQLSENQLRKRALPSTFLSFLRCRASRSKCFFLDGRPSCCAVCEVATVLFFLSLPSRSNHYSAIEMTSSVPMSRHYQIYYVRSHAFELTHGVCIPAKSQFHIFFAIIGFQRITSENAVRHLKQIFSWGV